MHNCEFCGKGFQFPSKLLRHLSKKIPCHSNKSSDQNSKNVEKTKEIQEKVIPIQEKVIPNQENTQEKVIPNEEKVIQIVKKFHCAKCEKNFTSKQSLNYHLNICKGVQSLQCPTCLKTFSNKSGKNKHIKNVKCSPPEKKVNLEEEIESLRKEVAILKAKSKGGSITTNNNNITNNYNIKYQIKYNPETRCIVSNDPNAPFPELLCFNGFKHEAAKSKLKYIDQDALQKIIDDVRITKDYYALYSFFFRNVDNQRLHMFKLGKNNNATHAHVFNNGLLEKMEKSKLFDNVSKYIGQYLLNMSIENSDIIYYLTTDQKSRNAFIELTKDKSHTFDYYRDNDEVMELED